MVRTMLIFKKKHSKYSPQSSGIIFLLHGMGSCSALMAPAAAFFRDLNYDVFAFDQLGHGRSDGLWQARELAQQTPLGDGGKGTPDAYIPDYRLLYSISWRFMHHIIEVKHKNRFQVHPPVFLYGHAVGGATIVEMLLNTPVNSPVSSKIKAVVLDSVCLQLKDAPTNPLVIGLLRGISSLVPSLPVTIAVNNPLSNHDLLSASFSRLPDQVELRKSHPECFHGALPLGTAREVLNLVQDLADVMTNQQQRLEKNLDFPMLLMHGTMDNICPHEGSQKLYNLLKHTGGKELKLFENAFHCLIHDQVALEALEMASSFFSKYL